MVTPWTAAARVRPRADAGFTLVELLMALAVLGLLSAALSGSLRFGAKAWERGNAHASGAEDVRVAQAVVRRRLQQAYPLFRGAEASRPRVEFKGTGDGLSFLAPAPSSMLPGGFAWIRLGAERMTDQVQLVISAWPELADRRESGASKEVLLARLAGIEISYFGKISPDQKPSWSARWEDRGELPDLVRVHVTFPDGDTRTWPDLVVAPRITVDVACIFDPLTKYCRGR